MQESERTGEKNPAKAEGEWQAVSQSAGWWVFASERVDSPGPPNRVEAGAIPLQLVSQEGRAFLSPTCTTSSLRYATRHFPVSPLLTYCACMYFHCCSTVRFDILVLSSGCYVKSIRQGENAFKGCFHPNLVLLYVCFYAMFTKETESWQCSLLDIQALSTLSSLWRVNFRTP